MRNLSVLSAVPQPLQDGIVAQAIAFDVDENKIFVISESVQDDSVSFGVWALSQSAPAERVAHLTCPKSDSKQDRQLVSAKFLPETRSLCLISAAGDIACSVLDDGASLLELEIVGSVESGIRCAQWSPDDDVVVLVTGDDNLLQMTKDFEVISEARLVRQDFGEEKAVDVGWGSKETQFHGSLGKGAAAASAEQAASAARGGSSPDDDGRPRVSWRGDGAYFVVSSLDPHEVPPTTPEPHTHRRRVLRVYDRAGVLQSTSEPTPGLEQAVAWRPSGGLIACAQRFGFPGGGYGKSGRHDVVFFERNGLRHGEFTLREEFKESVEAGRRWGYRVREAAWNADSTALALWIERDGGDAVQLWTTGNYHWYLKQEIPARYQVDDLPPRFTSVSWHPEDSMRLVVSSSSLIEDYRFIWDTCASSASSDDSATVGVVDGASLLLTPFRLQNVPPPMSSYKLSRPSAHMPPPIHVALAPNADEVALLYENAVVELWALQTKPAVTKGDVAEPVKLWEGEIPGNLVSRQVLAWVDPDAPEERFIALLGIPRDGKHDVVSVVALRGGVITDDYETALPAIGHGHMVFLDGGKLAWEDRNGQVLHVDFENELTLPLASFSEYCPQVRSVQLDGDMWLLCGLSAAGKLQVTTSDSLKTLASNCTSFTLGAGFLIYTTAAHAAYFAPISQLAPLLLETEGDTPLPEWEQRRVERGSRIVTVVPSAMSLVLQMPRGNLETINPRPLVLAIVKQDIDAGDYRKAFLACRKHRIDLNVLVDHDPEAFMNRLTSFVDQAPEVDYINLFLSGIGQSAQAPSKIAEICDAIRLELEERDLKKYVNSILTAHVVKTPPDVEAGLALLLRLRETDATLVEDAVKYIIFLVDADTLFDTALGMYDFSLVLLVAQHSPKKDPREYLPFLRELRSLEEAHGKDYQKFKIDDYLKRYPKALQGLHDAGSAKFGEATAYIEEHRLYKESLEIWHTHNDERNSILNLYGDYLFERREFRQAALAFIQGSRVRKAMIAYEKAYAWQELFALAVKEGLSFDELVELGKRVGEELASRKRYSEAARVLLDYAKNVDEAIAAFAQGGEFGEAERVCALESRMDLVETILYPGAFEIRDQIGEDIQEFREQLSKQSERLTELREKKKTDPESYFYPDHDRTNLQNVDVMTDAASTVAGTTFTRYTVAPTATSKKSKGSSKTRKKLARGKGRKGTFEEEEYIIQSIAKMPPRLEALKARTAKVLPYLLMYTPEHLQAGKALQAEIIALEEFLQKVIAEAWTEEEEEEEVEAPIPRPRAPTLMTRKPDTPATIDWRVNLLE